MKKIPLLLLLQGILAVPVFAQINAGLFRYPDVSATQIVFTYANDVWVMPKAGGMANKLSSPAGVEMFPKFSPDGKSIASMRCACAALRKNCRWHMLTLVLIHLMGNKWRSPLAHRPFVTGNGTGEAQMQISTCLILKQKLPKILH